MLKSRPSLLLTGCVPLFALIINLGCSVSQDNEASADIKWVDLINQLTEPERAARLDTFDSKLISSSDPTRGNKDHNHFERIEKRDGRDWIVIADIKGPGYVSRYWCTGANNEEHPMRFYFNNERKPRLETNYREFFGGIDPYLPPLANREQGCWYSYLPIPFSERLVIMIEERDNTNGQQVKDYHQINYSLIEDGRSIETFPKKISQEQMAVAEKARSFWLNMPTSTEIAGSTVIQKSEKLAPSSIIYMDTLTGPAIITGLEIEPDFATLQSPTEREKLLRDLVLQITWNGEEKPSVNVPVGDFFGSFLRRTRFETLYVGMKDSTFFSKFPMPFEKSADISVRNDGKSKIPITIRATVRQDANWDNNLGYFHSAWNKSGPEQKGKPHIMLKTEGQGKYVGCFLSIMSRDQSWWALESNDYIYTDDDVSPSWMGTGLEDYFNGGWYYQNPMVRPLSGLLFHTPFKTVQYRLHMTDPVHFNKRIYFEFERGPNQVSNADMASVVYYYLCKPAAAPSIARNSDTRYDARTEFEEHTLMRELNNQDMIGDLQGAYDHIDEYLERFPNCPDAEMLRLRQLAYREEILGFDTVKSEHEKLIDCSSNKLVISESKKILWFHESNSNALLQIYSNGEVTPFLDGKAYGRYDNPEMAFSIPLVISEGKHTLCLKARQTRQQPWTLTRLRTHKGNLIKPQKPWRYSTVYIPEMHSPNYDDTSWPLKLCAIKGPPEIPFIRFIPNPYVGMLPNSQLTRANDKPGPDGFLYYRQEFQY